MWSSQFSIKKKIVRAFAPAKVNLHLDILDKRQDGYHNLLSLFQSVSLFDTLNIRSTPKKGSCIIKGNFNFQEDQNIIKKAYKAFRESTGVETGFEVKVEKRIPIGAGLGGGSSNAAAALMAFFIFSGKTPSKSIKKKMAEVLGSDVFFFLEASAAIISGRGEIVKPIKARLNYSIIIIYPGFSINTSLAYKWIDDYYGRARSKSRITASQIESIYYKDSPSNWKFYNSFTEVLRKRYPFYDEVIQSLILSGALFANVTGSGSAVFGIYEKKEFSKALFNKYKNKYPFVIIANPLDKIPLPVLE